MTRRITGVLMCVAAFSLTLTAAAREYRAAGNYTVGTHPVAIAVGDFNSDGKIDLAVANFGSRSVSVLLGKGDGTFQARQDFETGVAPWSLAVTDLDGDGIKDLVVGSRDNTQLSVLFGYGDGTFGPHVDLGTGDVSAALLATLRSQSTKSTTGRGIASFATGDFNGDGELDQAATLSATNRVSVLLGGLDLVPGQNLLQNGGFDDGTLSPWAVGRNYCSSECHPWALSHQDPQSGNGDALDVGNIEMVQDFTATPTSSIKLVSFWIRHPAGEEPTAFDFFYSNGDDDEYVVETTDHAWDYFEVTSDLASGLSLDAFSVWGFETSADVSEATFADTMAIGLQ
jgi:hypothetical protein